jgi:hypothetical protein
MKRTKNLIAGWINMVTFCFLTASSETYREGLEHCELNRDLFLNMPHPLKEMIVEIKKRME